MEALKKKWNSCRGASILLALLFLLVCMMAGASIVMAGASNAGKIRSNTQEQQKYLVLSSAIDLIVDELESVEYIGRYRYGVEVETREKPVEVPTERDNEENEDNEDPEPAEPPEYITYTYTTYTYAQADGILRYRADGTISANDWTGTNKLDKVLPLDDTLDIAFSNAIGNKYADSTVQIDSTHFVTHTYTKKTTDTFNGISYTLTLKVNNVTGLPETVQVKVTLEKDGSIHLTAYIVEKQGSDWESTGYTMHALLRTDPIAWPEARLDMSSTTKHIEDSYCWTKPIRWKLDHIYK